MDKKNQKTSDQVHEQAQAMPVRTAECRRIVSFDGNAAHICRGFECQQQGKTNRSEKRVRE